MEQKFLEIVALCVEIHSASKQIETRKKSLSLNRLDNTNDLFRLS